MQYFGDASGKVNNVLDGTEDVFSASVVAGPPFAVAACPKKIVRNNTILDEAKWTDLKPKSKRRVLNCMAERTEDIKFAFATIDRRDITSLQNHYILFDGSDLPAQADIFVKSIIYTTLLESLGCRYGKNNDLFYFDRFASRPSWKALIDLLEEMHGHAEYRDENSQKRSSIQAADCVAGAARQKYLDGTNWLSHLPSESTSDESASAFQNLKLALEEISTAP